MVDSIGKNENDKRVIKTRAMSNRDDDEIYVLEDDESFFGDPEILENDDSYFSTCSYEYYDIPLILKSDTEEGLDDKQEEGKEQTDKGKLRDNINMLISDEDFMDTMKKNQENWLEYFLKNDEDEIPPFPKNVDYAPIKGREPPDVEDISRPWLTFREFFTDDLLNLFLKRTKKRQ